MHKSNMTNSDKYADLAYTLGADNQIIATSIHWDQFALENGGASACSEHVLQRDLLDFVTGEELKLLLGNLLKCVRVQQRVMRVPFRCDAPTRRRHMIMTIAPGEHQHLTVHTELSQAVERPASDDLPEGVDEGTPIHLCAWCNRIRLEGTWRELEQGISHLGLFCESPIPPLNHGICDDCLRLLEAELPGKLPLQGH